MADTYHGKVVTLEAATQLIRVEQDVNLGDLEQIIPYSTARDIVLRNPDHIVVIDCPCRSARANPCLPLDVCLIVGEPFASFIAEHQPARSRWITRDEAEQILREEHGRGHVHHAFFKDAMLGRFYAICNCCECCCAILRGMIQFGQQHALARSDFRARVDAELCTGCGTCQERCHFGALILVDEICTVNAERCMGCGLCATACPTQALVLERHTAQERSEPPVDHRQWQAERLAGRQQTIA